MPGPDPAAMRGVPILSSTTDPPEPEPPRRCTVPLPFEAVGDLFGLSEFRCAGVEVDQLAQVIHFVLDAPEGDERIPRHIIGNELPLLAGSPTEALPHA